MPLALSILATRSHPYPLAMALKSRDTSGYFFSMRLALVSLILSIPTYLRKLSTLAVSGICLAL